MLHTTKKRTEGLKSWLPNRASLPLVIKASALSLYAWFRTFWLVAWDSGASPESYRVSQQKSRKNFILFDCCAGFIYEIDRFYLPNLQIM